MQLDKSLVRICVVLHFLLLFKKYETSIEFFRIRKLFFRCSDDYEGPAGSTNSSILDANDLNTKLKDNIK